MTKEKLKNTAAALVAVAVIIGPELKDFVDGGALNWRSVLRGLVGFLIALAVNGKLVALFNLIVGAEKKPDAMADPPKAEP